MKKNLLLAVLLFISIHSNAKRYTFDMDEIRNNYGSVSETETEYEVNVTCDGPGSSDCQAKDGTCPHPNVKNEIAEYIHNGVLNGQLQIGGITYEWDASGEGVVISMETED